MRRRRKGGVGRFVWRLIRPLVLLVVILLIPSAYVELACRAEQAPSDYRAILPPEDHRPESRTLLTYQEWHIVHAYDDYAKTIRDGDPHEYGFLRAIFGYWSNFCTLSKAADRMDRDSDLSRQTAHVIGVSFTVEMALKALYEETLGRLTANARGATKAPLDVLSAEQATRYAAFLRQTPWYDWRFRDDADALELMSTKAARDRERRFALGLEYRAKAAYAEAMRGLVDATGDDDATLRMVVAGLSPSELRALDGVRVIDARPEDAIVEVPRFAALTTLLARMAEAGATFLEIAGNDEIMLTTTGTARDDALLTMRRQGYGDHRNLTMVAVRDLADHLRGLAATGQTLEHVHDY